MDNQFNRGSETGYQGQGQSGYGGTGSTGAGTAASTVDKLKDQVAEKATSAKNAIADAGRKAVDKINESRQPAASSLESAASSLHQTADSIPGGLKTGVDKVASAAHATADKLQATANYVRNTDVSAMMTDVEGLVKQYPGQSLLAAAAVGFLVGRVFRSDS